MDEHSHRRALAKQKKKDILFAPQHAVQGLKKWPGNRETDRETDRERQTERQTERERRTFKHRESAEQQRMCVCECVWSLMFVLAQLLLPHL